MRLPDNLADVTQMNILVDGSGRARVADFSFAAVDYKQCLTCGVVRVNNIDTRWTGPEILDGKNPLTKEADVFSFAMLVVEVSLGACPTATSG